MVNYRPENSIPPDFYMSFSRENILQDLQSAELSAIGCCVNLKPCVIMTLIRTVIGRMVSPRQMAEFIGFSYGFPDMVFLPKRASLKPAFILELKWDRTAEGAISQTKNKKYVSALKEYKGNVLLVGIDYEKKSRKINAG